MRSPLGFLPFDANVGMAPQKGHESVHALLRCLIALFLEHFLIVQFHAGLPSANLFSNHWIHRLLGYTEVYAVISSLVQPLAGATANPYPSHLVAVAYNGDFRKRSVDPL